MNYISAWTFAIFSKNLKWSSVVNRNPKWQNTPILPYQELWIVHVSYVINEFLLLAVSKRVYYMYSKELARNYYCHWLYIICEIIASRSLKFPISKKENSYKFDTGKTEKEDYKSLKVKFFLKKKIILWEVNYSNFLWFLLLFLYSVNQLNFRE